MNSLYKSDEFFEGFTVQFEALPECESIKYICDDMSEVDAATTLNDIRLGKLVVFVARVTALRAGVELAETFLGGCIYTSYSDFLAGDGYYSDMRRDAVNDAKIKLQVLQIPDKAHK